MKSSITGISLVVALFWALFVFAIFTLAGFPQAAPIAAGATFLFVFVFAWLMVALVVVGAS
jgi:hypothetical protein